MNRKSTLYKYSFVWVTLILFLGSIIGHWAFGWKSYIQDQEDHGQPVEVRGYINEMMRDTLENWQSEFLQLIWQVAGLSFLFYIGSSQSKEGDDRKEEKLDLILKAVSPKEADEQIKKLDRQYPKR
jgi:hypothetical protein